MNAMHRLARDLRTRVQAQLPHLLDARCVLAASGGADSTAMVSLLLESGVVRPADAVVAHFNHGTREEAAHDRDRQAVAALCARYGLRMVVGEWGSPVHGEASAREARYAFFADVARQRAAPFVITGHTADDQAETVLLHALRGAGLHGLAGMMSDARLPLADRAPAPRILRPLLAVRRAETRAWCAEHELPFEDDETNDNLTYRRNHVRRRVLPLLEAAQPDIIPALIRLAEGARTAATSIDRAIGALVPATSRTDGVLGITLDRSAMRALDAGLRTYAMRLAAVRLLGDARDLSRMHLETMAAAATARTGATFEFPRRLVLTVDARALVLTSGPPGCRTVDGCFEARLPFVGEIGEWRVSVVPAAPADGGDGLAVPLPPDAVVRARRPGDRIAMRAGTKKLKDWYIDAGIPRRLRDAAPIVARGADVLWTPWTPATSGDASDRRWRIAASRREADDAPEVVETDATRLTIRAAVG